MGEDGFNIFGAKNCLILWNNRGSIQLELQPRLISLFEDVRVATGLTVCLKQSGGQCFHNGNIDHKIKK